MTDQPEENIGATRLAWSDDEDDFFGENEAEDTKSAGDGWGESFGDDDEIEDDGANEEEVNVNEAEKGTDEANDFEPETAEDFVVVGEENAHREEEDVDAPPVAIEEEETPVERTSSPVIVNSGDAIPPVAPSSAPSNERPPLPSTSGKVPGTPIPTDSAISSLQSRTPGTPFAECDDADDKFEAIVRKRNKSRKEKEDYHIAHLKVQMGRLENALAAETKRRVDATTALDDMGRTQVYDMEQRVRQQLEEENDKLHARLDALEERVKKLEDKWSSDAKNQVELVNTKASDLGKAIGRIQEDQDMERKARLKREGILMQQVETHAKDTEERWASERAERTQRLKELEDKIIRNEARLAMEQKRYEERIESELNLLKEELEIEVEERLTQDEQIVAALNRYTQQLQHSLSILSSD